MIKKRGENALPLHILAKSILAAKRQLYSPNKRRPLISDTPTPRMDALNAALPRGYVIKPAEITADEARALIDSVLRSFGLEPAELINASGWARLI